MREVMLTIFFCLLIVILNVATGFSVEFEFNKRTYPMWRVWNYNEQLHFEIERDNETSQEYLRITLTELAAFTLTRDEEIDTAFRLTSPVVRVEPDKVYYIKVKRRCSLDIPFSELSKGCNYIIWYDMYNEEIGKIPLNGMGNKRDSTGYFVDTGLLALPEAEKAMIVLGVDWPDFSEKDFLDIFEVRFKEYQNRPFDFEEEGDFGWEITFNHQSHLVTGICEGGVDGSKYCYRVERNRTGNADTAFRLAFPYIPVKPDSFHVLSFEERHNYDFTHVTEGYCQVLWYDAERNLIGKSDMGSLLQPHLEWFLWMKPFFRSPKGARLARIEFGNDWPDFKCGDFWEVDNVWLRAH